MAPRTSARSKKASSPPQSPASSRARGTRTASVELGTNSKGAAKRRGRQASVDSVGSEQAGLNRARGGRQASQDLAAVDEDAEGEYESIPNDGVHGQGFADEGGSSQEPSPEPELLPSAHIAGDLSANNEEGIRAYKDFQQSKQKSSNRPGSRQAQAGSSRSNVVNPVQTQEALNAWQHDRRDKNKENKRPSGQKRKLTDPQPDEERLEWESQELESPQASPPQASRKRARVEEQQQQFQHPEEQDEDSQDEGFEADKRVTDPNRRIPKAPAVPRMVESPGRFQPSQEMLEARQAAILEGIPIETIVKTQARLATQQAALRNKRSQIRVPWSQHDEQLLTQYIGEHGVSWAMLAKMPGWENSDRPNFQVQLKDKARNLKVAYLKAGITLPHNFSHVRLGKKEIEAVQKVYPEYDQDNDIEL